MEFQPLLSRYLLFKKTCEEALLKFPKTDPVHPVLVSLAAPIKMLPARQSHGRSHARDALVSGETVLVGFVGFHHVTMLV